MTITAAETALRDQLGAARTENLAVAADLLKALSTRYPRRASQAVAEIYVDQLVHRGLDGCPHIQPGAPRPGWWTADAPTVVRCAACLQAWMRRPGDLAGCDLCGQLAELRPVAVAVAPVIARTLDGALASVPPAVLLAGACSSCWNPR